MLKNYFKTALRSLLRKKGHFFINMAGLSVGMTVAILIGLWIWDELSFNKYHSHYDSIAQVMQHQLLNNELKTHEKVPAPLGNELSVQYGSNFKRVVVSAITSSHILAVGDNLFSKTGNYMEEEAPELLSLKMLKGSREGLKDPASILLSESVAKALFAGADPMDKLIKIDDRTHVKVTGIYEDIPYNSQFRDLTFIAPWKLLVSIDERMKKAAEQWDNNSVLIYVQLSGHADINKVSKQIQDVRLHKIDAALALGKPQLFLSPMSRWHLYSEWKNGKNAGGRIQFVWLFGIIGVFVLLLACINFMNLSTARSEKRAKEVGIRKAIGSLRLQLIVQFFCESLLVVSFAFVLSLVLVLLTLPYFNELVDKNIKFFWDNPWFWLISILFGLLTAVVAGSYPAFYLSSFQAIKALKSTFRMGRLAAIPRKVLVVVQFTVSVTLIIGTIIVFKQIQFAKERPIGYNRDGLLWMEMKTKTLYEHFDAFRNDLLQSGAIVEVSESSSPVTEPRNIETGFDWKNKPAGISENFVTMGITYEYGKTLGWQFKQGRDFSREYGADAMSMVINESAAKFMALNNPIGEKVRWKGGEFTIIGVTNNMVMQSPYDPVLPTVYYVSPWWIKIVNIKLNPSASAGMAIDKIEAAFKKYAPGEPFNYKFADQEYDAKFRAEERIGVLASFFAILTIFISCLGLFGLASFVAEQRTKEIGIRKVLGASVLGVWQLLSKDFVVLVCISVFISIPVSWFFMAQWLQNFHYRSELSWWIFAIASAGAIVITLLTVSFQALRAALMNPSRSLRTE